MPWEVRHGRDLHALCRVGLHEKTAMACRAPRDPTGQQADGIMELKEFGTMTVDLLALSDWLATGDRHHAIL